MNKLHSTLLAGAMIVGFACSARASNVEFLAFDSGLSSTSGITYTAVAPTSPPSAPGVSTLTGSCQVQFEVLNPLGETTYTPGMYYGGATLTVTATTSEGANLGIGNSALDSLKVSITDGGTNILTMTAGQSTNASLPIGLAGNLITDTIGDQGTLEGNNAAGVSAVGPNYVLFSSSLFNFGNGTSAYALTDESFNIGITPTQIFNYLPGTFPVTNNYLASFVTQYIQGSFASSMVPEPGSLALIAGALVSFGALRLRRRK